MRRSSGYLFRGPYWLTAKWKGTCANADVEKYLHAGCVKVVNQGERAYYFPGSKTLLCRICGEQAERDQAAAEFDERQYQSQYTFTGD